MARTLRNRVLYLKEVVASMRSAWAAGHFARRDALLEGKNTELLEAWSGRSVLIVAGGDV